MAINKEKNTRIVITLPKEVKEQVQELANKDNRTMTNYIVNLILKDLESKK
ncbi:ribbon-helix-helix domain-containing protein [Terrisporobacter hibernicus]|uniref:DNA-binding protein n=1 Tax=Terrisporobacter hibernicus TaxID=2813371 RepID=A0AAX2ZIH2_9FIRM|nr:DNA-binding protein [Terrisporobacter hibernicus]UEL48290.1 DNA-binding protein [Terrisporobacter hibernicus]